MITDGGDVGEARTREVFIPGTCPKVAPRMKILEEQTSCVDASGSSW